MMMLDSLVQIFLLPISIFANVAVVEKHHIFLNSWNQIKRGCESNMHAFKIGGPAHEAVVLQIKEEGH
jgi:hypothetical protein